MVDISGFNAFKLPEFMTETKRLAVLEQPSGLDECIASGSYEFCLWFENIPMALNRREKVNETDLTNFMNVRNEIEEMHSKDSTKRRLKIQESITLSLLFGFIREKIKNWLIGQEYSLDKIKTEFGRFFKTKSEGSIFFKGSGQTYTIPYVHEIKEFILKRIAQ